jgi:DNA-binding response OmpR family regulator
LTISRPYPGPLRDHPAASRLTNKRIVVAEDDGEIRKMLRIVLDGVGAIAVEAASGAAASAAARAARTDAVVLDWHLAGQAAGDLVAEISAIDAAHPARILIITGDPRVATRLAQSQRGPAVLLKPFLPVDFVVALADAVDSIA